MKSELEKRIKNLESAKQADYSELETIDFINCLLGRQQRVSPDKFEKLRALGWLKP